MGCDVEKNLGELKYFDKNYNINIDDQMKKKVVPVSYNYIIDNN